ncbi:response regulator [Spirosoma soli]|uniref:Response regulator n=1 Tax=Spirosoma soli TaxID=1770529 RepID=A0ABW5M5X4_9BACT
MVTNRLIYLVDDAADYRFLAQQVFSRFVPQAEVRFFISGDDLYQCNQTEQVYPDLILMDLNMPPGLNGIDTVRLLRQSTSWKLIPVVIMSNSASDEEMTQCLEAGANSFLAKSLDFNQMKDTMVSVSNYWLSLNRIPSRQRELI